MNKSMEIFDAFNTISLQIKNFKPTLIYCEGWLLRLVMIWFNENRNIKSEIKFMNNATWFSEASLSTFFQKKKLVKYSEGTTFCDAVYGNIAFYPNSYKIRLKNDCKQLVVIEAKMYSGFSSGTANAKDNYDQASRIICCMCYLFAKQNIIIDKVEELAFYTFIPEKRPNDRRYGNHIENFRKSLQKEKIKLAIKDRFNDYSVSYNERYNMNWYNNKLIPFLEKIKIKLFSWEEIIRFIDTNDKEYGNRLNEFYNKCIKYNM